MALWPHTVRQKYNKAIRISFVTQVSSSFWFRLAFKKNVQVLSPRDRICLNFFFLAIISCLGGVQLGDQLLNVDGTSLLGLSVEHAQEELNKAMNRETVSCLIDA